LCNTSSIQQSIPAASHWRAGLYYERQQADSGTVSVRHFASIQHDFHIRDEGDGASKPAAATRKTPRNVAPML
jgi:hypothetical protein